MHLTKLLISILSVAVTLFASKLEKAPKVPPEYFPVPDLRQLYNTTKPIWTVIGRYNESELPKTDCKFDEVSFETYGEVVFVRAEHLNGRLEKRNLKGVFIDLEWRYEPTVMQIHNAINNDAHTEKIVYADEKKRCGIILTYMRVIPQGQKYFHSKYYSYSACELRLRGDRRGPRDTNNCMNAYYKICVKGKEEQVFNENLCKP